jgi:hypothetical protein
LRGSSAIIAALDGVADVDDETGVFGIHLAPDALVDAGLRVAGAIAKNRKTEVIGRGLGGEDR